VGNVRHTGAELPKMLVDFAWDRTKLRKGMTAKSVQWKRTLFAGADTKYGDLLISGEFLGADVFLRNS